MAILGHCRGCFGSGEFSILATSRMPSRMPCKALNFNSTRFFFDSGSFVFATQKNRVERILARFCERVHFWADLPMKRVLRSAET